MSAPNKHQIKRIIEQVTAYGAPKGDFDDNMSKTVGLRNAIIRHLKSQGGHIDRSAAMGSEQSFDNLVLRIIEMTNWSE